MQVAPVGGAQTAQLSSHSLHSPWEEEAISLLRQPRRSKESSHGGLVQPFPLVPAAAGGTNALTAPSGQRHEVCVKAAGQVILSQRATCSSKEWPSARQDLRTSLREWVGHGAIGRHPQAEYTNCGTGVQHRDLQAVRHEGAAMDPGVGCHHSLAAIDNEATPL